MAKEAIAFAGVFNAGDVFPSLQLLDSLFGSKRKLAKLHKKVDNILEDIIQEHEKDRLTLTGNEPFEEDLHDVFLRLKADNEFPIDITREIIKANIFVRRSYIRCFLPLLFFTFFLSITCRNSSPLEQIHHPP